MIEITLGGIGAICGYLGTLWCVANLFWGLLRNDARRVLIYGIGVFAAALVALNVGGILNDYTWSLFGLLVFGLHMAVAAWQHAWWKVPVFAFLFGVSTLSFMGVIRRTPSA